MGGVQGKEIEASWFSEWIGAVWDGVILGDSRWNPDRSCYDLADEYRASGRTPDECVSNFIDWQTAKAGAGGFVAGLGGFATLPVAIPADLTFTTYLQLRMIATIGLLHGWDAKSDRFKTVALVCLIGSSGAEAVRSAGVHVGTKISANLLSKIPGSVLLQINRQVGFRLITKAGTTGVINLSKLVPILGGLVSGGLNAVTTREIGRFAHTVLKQGPGEPAEEAAQ